MKGLLECVVGASPGPSGTSSSSEINAPVGVSSSSEIKHLLVYIIYIIITII